MTDFIELLRAHYAQHLGAAGQEITFGDDPVVLYEHADVPVEGCRTYATLGLAETLTHDGAHPLDQEIVLCVGEEWCTDDLLKILGSLCDEIRSLDQPLWYGRQFGPAGPLLPGARTEGFVITPALYFDRGFDAVERDGREILVMLLAPAHASEMGWLAEHGIEEFTDQLKSHDPDLVDLAREPMSLAALRDT